MIYYAISVLIEPFDSTMKLIEDNDLVEFYKEKINEVYKQIKKNEMVSSDFEEYNKLQKNLNRSIHKINLLDSVDYLSQTT
jgi:SMC interacting uncharacterized protein involved in chromosome segregation